MNKWTDQLLAEIEAFMTEHGMSPTGFGATATGDRHLVKRLRNGGTVNLDTADSIRLFMTCYRPPKSNRARGNDRAAA